MTDSFKIVQYYHMISGILPSGAMTRLLVDYSQKVHGRLAGYLLYVLKYKKESILSSKTLTIDRQWPPLSPKRDNP